MTVDAVTIRLAKPEDKLKIDALHAAVFGPGRFTRTAYRIREASFQDPGFAWVALAGGTLAGSVLLTPIEIGAAAGAFLLGPLMIAPEYSGLGFGRRLIATALEAARADGAALVLLVGNLDYYGSSGFQPVPPGQIRMPGPVDPARLLAYELAAGSLKRFQGLMRAARRSGR